jgi:hypothetical protein
MYSVISLRSERTWFGSHCCARELSFSQSVFPDSHAMPRIHYVPLDFSAQNYPTKVDVNGTSPSSVFAENAWRYNYIAQYLTTVFNFS